MKKEAVLFLCLALASPACKQRVPSEPSGAAAAKQPEAASTTPQVSTPIAPYAPKDRTKPTLFPARMSGKYGFIDKTGKTVIEARFQRALEFTEGLAAVEDARGQWGYIDSTGNLAIKPLFAAALPFSEGLGSVRMGDKFGCINKAGEIVIPAKFAGIGPFNEGLAETLVEQTVQGMAVRGWGFIKTDALFPIVPQYDAIGPFGEGVAPVRIFGKKWGFIDKDRKIKVQPVFEAAFQFSEGLAAVQSSYQDQYKWGFINHDGKYVIQPRFSVARTFSEGLVGVRVTEGAKWGFVNKTGSYVIKPIYDDVGQFHNGIALAKLGQKERYIDTTGKTVWQEK
jgi:WG containing repeat